MPGLELQQNIFYYIVDPLIYLFLLLSILLIVWGIVILIKNSDSEEGLETGKRHLIWGIVGFTVVVSSTAIIEFLSKIL